MTVRQIGYFYLLNIIPYLFGTAILENGHYPSLYENISNLCTTYVLEEDAIVHMIDDSTDQMILAGKQNFLN
ncbi:hypothetical protein T10_7989 [Trichinella papuae]|uniref:Uncharacterized protein n=1 Tax=Trichinella papuae TaxID=268474 RepID=A0A0V1N8B0_9BILA|nr:hypothetical protein T10_7989 [Trichinella papuae]